MILFGIIILPYSKPKRKSEKNIVLPNFSKLSTIFTSNQTPTKKLHREANAFIGAVF